MTIRVLIADDERLVRAGFRMILASEPDIEVVGEAATGREALEASRRVRPDVILMDVRMPVMDGLSATRELASWPQTDPDAPCPRVIVVTTFDLDEYVFGSLQAGASGFLLKDAPEAQLLAAIRVAADGGSMFAPTATRRLIASFARRGPPADRTAAAELTARELEVMRLVARGLSNREIADELTITEHTAKTHVAHILAKLGFRDRIQAVVFAYETGLAHDDPA